MKSVLGVLKGKVDGIFEKEFEGQKSKVAQIKQVDKRGKGFLVDVGLKNGLEVKVGQDVTLEGRFYSYKIGEDAQIGFAVA